MKYGSIQTILWILPIISSAAGTMPINLHDLNGKEVQVTSTARTMKKTMLEHWAIRWLQEGKRKILKRKHTVITRVK